ncbi:MAG: glycosyltransferase family 39 protein [Anaerolineae bacterium]|nr:glycosyltransferase family 39 protein [Anaerolineae bacterium]MDW8071902.1 glycosyltransferase family 39 protein [Anaerolineae bacterium]
MRSRLGLVGLLTIFTVVTVCYGVLKPLGEAPDEMAHMHLIRFISQKGHPPLAGDRQEAGYKADVPVLYHLLIATLLNWVDYEALPSLRQSSLNPRDLIIADGLTPWSVIHTEDEMWPWRGVVLAMHLARLISTMLSLGTIWIIYRAALALLGSTNLLCPEPYRQWWALGASALVAFNPQFGFIASSVNDDNLLGLLMALAAWSFIKAWQAPHRWCPWIAGGICLGLSLTTKYSMALVLFTVPFWLILSSRRAGLSRRAALGRFVVCCIAVILVSAWWFGFRIAHFNRIGEMGLIPGIVAALAERADISARRVVLWLGAIHTNALLLPLSWSEWLTQIVVSFWLPGAPSDSIVGLVLIATMILLLIVVVTGLLRRMLNRKTYALTVEEQALKWPFMVLALHIALLVPFPVLRYYLSGNINESAQGRHILFPAAVPVGLLLAAGLTTWFSQKKRLSALLIAAGVLLVIGLINFCGLIMPTFPEPLPVRTNTSAAGQVANPTYLPLSDAVELLGYEVHPLSASGALPVTLTWHSTSDSSKDFLNDVFLLGEDGNIYARWLGYPAEGRYPARAWRPGEMIRDEIWLVVTGLRAGTYRLCLRLLPITAIAHPELTSDGGHCLTTLTLPNVSTPVGRHAWQLPDGRNGTFNVWQAGQANHLPLVFRYRATIQVSVHAQPSKEKPYTVTLVGPNEVEEAALCQTGNVYTFLVGARWSAGRYRVRLRSGDQSFTSAPVLEVRLRQRNFAIPPMQHVVNANFGGEITLLGYDLPERKVQPGGALSITLYWRAERDVQRHYIVFNHLLGADLRQWGGRDRIPRDYYSTALWTAGEVVRDDYLIPVDATAPPGVYHLDVGLYQVLQGQIRPVWRVDAAGKPLNANSVTLTAVKVGGAPLGTIVNGTLSPEHSRADNLGGSVTLVGYDLTMRPTHLEVVLYWRCDASLPTDYTTFVHLTKMGTAEIVAQVDRPPANGAYPTSLWDVGDVVRDAVTVPLPAELPPGRYDLLVGLYDPVTGRRLAVEDPAALQPPQNAIRLTTLHLPAKATSEPRD